MRTFSECTLIHANIARGENSAQRKFCAVKITRSKKNPRGENCNLRNFRLTSSEIPRTENYIVGREETLKNYPMIVGTMKCKFSIVYEKSPPYAFCAIRVNPFEIDIVVAEEKNMAMWREGGEEGNGLIIPINR